MSEPRRILLLDDDEDLLELYRDMLTQLPSNPEVTTVTSGDAAFSMLESQVFHVLISDLRMPRMDGLQVVTIVRKRFPNLKTVVMSGVGDEESKTRAFGLGVDLYLEKPRTAKEISNFNENVEKLLSSQALAADSGKSHSAQARNIGDAIQLECLSMGSCVINITKRSGGGKVFIERGMVIDAECAGQTGEEAFHQILAMGSAVVEVLPPEMGRHRTIVKSITVLLGLEEEQPKDFEAQKPASAFVPPQSSRPAPAPAPKSVPAQPPVRTGFPRQPVKAPPPPYATSTPLADLARTPELESLVSLESDGTVEALGVESKDAVASALKPVFDNWKNIAARFDWGAFEGFSATGPKLHWEVKVTPERAVSICFTKNLSRDQARESAKQVMQKWTS